MKGASGNQRTRDPRDQHTHTQTLQIRLGAADQEPTTDVGTVKADKVSRAGPSNFITRQDAGMNTRAATGQMPFPYLAAHTDAHGRTPVPNNVRAGLAAAVMASTLHSMHA